MIIQQPVLQGVSSFPNTDTTFSYANTLASTPTNSTCTNFFFKFPQTDEKDFYSGMFLMKKKQHRICIKYTRQGILYILQSNIYPFFSFVKSSTNNIERHIGLWNSIIYGWLLWHPSIIEAVVLLFGEMILMVACCCCRCCCYNYCWMIQGTRWKFTQFSARKITCCCRVDCI